MHYLFIFFRKKYELDIQNNKVIKTIFLFICNFFNLFFFVPSTTALYRMTLYLMPLQLKMASNIASTKYLIFLI